MNIYAYNTHYKITDYRLGSHYNDLEKMLSIYDETRHKRDTKFYYNEDTRELYIPRGFDEKTLSDLLDRPINYMSADARPKRISFTMKLPPRDDVQKESIRFLTGKDEYAYMADVHQAVLSLPGGGGKTYSAIAAMCIYGVKTMIVTHTIDIRDQWVKRFKEYTNLTDKSIAIIDGSSKLVDCLQGKSRASFNNASCYLVVHRTLDNFMSENGIEALDKVMHKLGIGLKIIDECHKEFTNTLMIDYATNVWKTFYLTATFKRSMVDDKLFQTSFNRVHKLYKNTEEMGQERNVYYIIDEFCSNISHIEVAGMYVRKMFSSYRYIDTELEYGDILDHVDRWLRWFYIDRGEIGKTYIISPKKSSCEVMYKLAKQTLPDKKVCIHNSDSKVDDLSEYDIICATFKMVGTGNDLDGLRMIINTEPIGSDANIDQLVHRLMRGKDNSNAYYIEPIDKRVPNIVNMLKRRKRVLKKFVKHILHINE